MAALSLATLSASQAFAFGEANAAGSAPAKGAEGSPTSEPRHPVIPKAVNPGISRRAFEALRKRSASPSDGDHVRGAIAAGRSQLNRLQAEMAERVGQAIGLAPPDREALAKSRAPSTPGSSALVPVLFVSSSMPVSTLRTFAAQLEQAGGVLALRGLPGGLTKVGPMARFAADILRFDPACRGPDCRMRNVQLIVDPMLFRLHGINAVPALAMVEGDPLQAWCEREESAAPSRNIIYGDAALTGLLAEFARLGGSKEVADVQARLGAR